MIIEKITAELGIEGTNIIIELSTYYILDTAEHCTCIICLNQPQEVESVIHNSYDRLWKR